MSRPTALRLFIDRNINTLLVAMLFLAVFTLVRTMSRGTFSYYDFSTTVGTGGTLALAAMGQTLVVISGGLDLSAGAVISLVNVFVAVNMGDTIASQVLVGALGIGIGAAVGSFNGFFIAVLRMQPIVVTLATLFIVQGLALLVSPTPGGYIPPEFTSFFAGDAIPGFVPGGFLVILACLAAWSMLKNSRFGTAIYAIGSDEHAAMAAGIRVQLTKFLTYVVAGAFYGLAGLFISAHSGGADPLVGGPMLLQIFAAVVIGGTALGGGRGGMLGTVIGAYLLMMFVNLLLIFALPTYLAPVADGMVLLLAVAVGALGSRDSFLRHLSEIRRELVSAGRNAARVAPPLSIPRIGKADFGASWMVRNRENIKLAVPAYAAFLILVVVTAIYFGGIGPSYFRSLLLLSTFLGIIAFGQTAVVISGGVDLSVPWSITLCAVVFVGLLDGDQSLFWAVPAVLAIGTLIGVANGVGVAVIGMPPIVVTLAANGILQGAALYLTGGTPRGSAPPALRWFLSGHFLGAPAVAWFYVAFTIVAVVLLTSTSFGRRIYAVGSNNRAAYLSGINLRAALISAYAISGFCAALVSVLLVGFNGAANLSMGDEYQLPSIAVVVAGGVLITGGRGHYLGVVGGVLLLVALQILVGGTTLPDAVRGIIFGFVMLGALLSLQERKPG